MAVYEYMTPNKMHYEMTQVASHTDVPNRAEHPNRKIGSFNASLTAPYVSGHPKMRDISKAEHQERMSSSNLDTVAKTTTSYV